MWGPGGRAYEKTRKNQEKVWLVNGGPGLLTLNIALVTAEAEFKTVQTARHV